MPYDEEVWTGWPSHIARRLADHFDSPEEIAELDDLSVLTEIDGIGEGRLDEIAGLVGHAPTESGGESASAGESAPEGIPWQDIIVFQGTPETLAAELRRRGIHTLQDLSTKFGETVGAIQAAHRLDYAALLRAAKEYEEEN